MAKNKATKFKGTENKGYIEAMRGIRGSSATTPQETREDRKRPRNVVKKQSVNFGW